jgi:hypothetical protein
MKHNIERPRTLDECRNELLKETLMKEFLLKRKHRAELNNVWFRYKEIENA